MTTFFQVFGEFVFLFLLLGAIVAGGTIVGNWRNRRALGHDVKGNVLGYSWAYGLVALVVVLSLNFLDSSPAPENYEEPDPMIGP